MTVKLLTGHHLEFLSLKGGCTGTSESTLVKMPYCWKSLVMAQLILMMAVKSTKSRCFIFLQNQYCMFNVRVNGQFVGKIRFHGILSKYFS